MKEACVKKKHCCQNSPFLEPMLPLNRGGFRGWSPTLKSKKVTLFTMVLYNSENNASTTIPNKTFVMFELSYCSRYMAILSYIVLSAQCTPSLLTLAKPLWNWLPLKYPTLKLPAGPTPASKMRNCAVPPVHLHSKISFSSTCSLPKHWKNTKTRGSYLT